MTGRGAAVRRVAGMPVRAISRTLALLLTGLITGYRRFVSPLLGPRCRFYPSCSTYALEAIRVHGPVKGAALSTARICRCNPWNAGGVDHVPARGSWRPDPYVPLTSWDDLPGDAVRVPSPETPLGTGDTGPARTPDRSTSWT